MKKFSVVLGMMLLVGVVGLTACGNKNITTNGNKKIDLIVFAAASMTETMNKIKIMYEAKHNDVNIIYNFDSSGTLLKQILAGADCDVFISAAQKQMNELDKNNFLLEETRINFLENKVVLAVPDGNSSNIQTFDDIKTDKIKLMAIGNADVPVGSYTLDIFKSIGTSEEELNAQNKLTYGSNVKEVTTQIKEGIVDCGIIYATDAKSAGLTVVDIATQDMCKQVIYPMTVLNISKNQDIAKDFLQFLTTSEVIKIFNEVGFTKA